MCIWHRRDRQYLARRAIYAAVWAAFAAGASGAYGQISINQKSGSEWDISNGNLTVKFSPTNDNLFYVQSGNSGNLLDPNNSQLYQEHAGTPFGSSPNATSGYQEGSNYIDFWTTTPYNPAPVSPPTAGVVTNPITYSFHYVLFNDDPNIVCYEVLNHSATDVATGVGQGQFIARFNTSLFTQSYQDNVGVNNLGPQTFTNVPTYPADGTPNAQTVDKDAGRNVTNATEDWTGSGLAGDFGSNFNTKYDFATYYQYLQAQTMYGSQYALSNIYTSMDTINGGPTKQGLTSTNLALIEFLSGHVGDANYSYVPPQGVDSTRLFGPFAFRITATNGESGAQLYQDAVNSMPALTADYNTDQELIANSYTPTFDRGSLQLTAGNSAGWSSNINNNMMVLSDPHRSFQESEQGSQYWAQVAPNGTATISNITPGTYRMSLYELGQWGETRIDGVTVNGGQVTIPQNVKFTPENFGTSIWTIGTPDRSDHEFLNGSNVNVTFANNNATATPITNNGVTPGGDLRQYYGNYNYWQEEQSLGTPGYVQYYATAVGATPATNNSLDWIGNQWGKFNPGIYDPADDTTDGYTHGYGPGGGQPAYVAAAGGAATYGGSPWKVNFTVTTAQRVAANYNYVDLSVGLASVEGSLTVALNGHSETWHFGGATGTPINIASDAMIRSADSGTYQFLVYQFPIADLNANGALDQFTFSASQADGVMYDALRMELATNSAAPTSTGWYDYEYITGSNTQTDAVNANGLTASQTFAPQAPALTWNNAGGSGDGATWDISTSQNWNNGSTVAYYVDGSNVTLNDANNRNYNLILNSTVSPGSVLVDASGNYTISGGGAIAGSGGLTKLGSGTLTIYTSNTYSGPTNINAGTVVAGVAGALSYGDVSVSPVAKLTLAPNIGAVNVRSLTIAAGGTVDLTNNPLAIYFGNNANPVATIRGYLQSAYNGGIWTSPGLTSSTVRAQVASAIANGGGVYAIGYADGNVDSTYIAAANQLVIMPALVGDANLDGSVTFIDLGIVAQNLGATNADWMHGDFNYDGTVNFLDIGLLAQNLSRNILNTPLGADVSPAFAAQWNLAVAEIMANGGATSVPEPGVLGLAAGAGMMMLRRRGRSRL